MKFVYDNMILLGDFFVLKLKILQNIDMTDYLSSDDSKM